jgi:hypothetical protein
MSQQITKTTRHWPINSDVPLYRLNASRTPSDNICTLSPDRTVPIEPTKEHAMSWKCLVNKKGNRILSCRIKMWELSFNNSVYQVSIIHSTERSQVRKFKWMLLTESVGDSIVWNSKTSWRFGKRCCTIPLGQIDVGRLSLKSRNNVSGNQLWLVKTVLT